MSPLASIRQRLANAGSDQRQIDLLRRVLAGSEDLKVLRAVGTAVSEVAEVADDRFLELLADLKDRVAEKMERLDAASSPSPSPAPRRPCASRNLRTTVSPQAHMIVTAWVEGADGILSREIYADPDAPAWRP